MARRQTLVQLTDELVGQLDAIAARRGVRRSQLIREALAEYARREDYQEKVRRDIEGYTKYPPNLPDEWGSLDDWAEWSARQAVAEESWGPSFADSAPRRTRKRPKR